MFTNCFLFHNPMCFCPFVLLSFFCICLLCMYTKIHIYVSYTHLDVYKRQVYRYIYRCKDYKHWLTFSDLQKPTLNWITGYRKCNYTESIAQLCQLFKENRIFKYKYVCLPFLSLVTKQSLCSIKLFHI